MRLHPNSTAIPCYFSFDTKLDSFLLYFTPCGARGGVGIDYSNRSFNVDIYHSKASGDEESHTFNVD